MKNNEEEIKNSVVFLVLGIIFGGCIETCILWGTLGKDFNIILIFALGITGSFGLGYVLTVYLFYYFKTHMIIRRENLKKLKKGFTQNNGQ